jgi:hypothetical protein
VLMEGKGDPDAASAENFRLCMADATGMVG